MKRIVLCLLFVCMLTLVVAKIPQYTDLYVNDFAGVLNPEDAQTLSETFKIVEENTTAEIVFVSLDTIEGNDISEYAIDIGEEWNVGKEDKDNGVIILYVKDINKIWVATGYSVEGVLPDSKIGRFLDTYYVPYRDRGEISTGIVAFSFILSEELIKNDVELRSTQKKKSNLPLIIFIIIVIIILSVIIFSAKQHRRRSGWLPIFIPSGGGGGFGGGSFGGGGFGGGGAGR